MFTEVTWHKSQPYEKSRQS